MAKSGVKQNKREPMNPEKRRNWKAMAALAALCMVVYCQNGTFAWTLYDDCRIIFENPEVIKGVTPSSIVWAFTHPNTGLYMPLPTLTYQVEYTLFGQWGGGYHLVTDAFHALASCLFFMVMFNLTRNFAAVFFAALLYAVYPIQAMSVNWLPSNNATMMDMFIFCAIEMYRRYTLTRSRKAYCYSLAFMFFSLLCKQNWTVLPGLLLMLDFWPLRRLEFDPRHPARSIQPAFRLFLEKLPYFGVSAIGVFFAFFGKAEMGVMAANNFYSPFGNIGDALIAYARYIGYMLFPVRMAMGYTSIYWEVRWYHVAGAALLMLGITAAALRGWRRGYPLVGWGWFVLVLLPVSRLVTYATESLALRYLYTAAPGLYLLAAFALYDLARAFPGGKNRPRRNDDENAPMPKWYWGVVAAVTALSVVDTVYQSTFWKNTETLAQRSLAVTGGNNAVAHNHLACLHGDAGLKDDSYFHLREMLRLEPYNEKAQLMVVMEMNRRAAEEKHPELYAESIKLIEPLAKKYPEKARIALEYGVCLMGMMRYEEAIEQFKRACEEEPGYYTALVNCASCLMMLGKPEEAKPFYEDALKANPTSELAKEQLRRIAQLRNTPGEKSK